MSWEDGTADDQAAAIECGSAVRRWRPGSVLRMNLFCEGLTWFCIDVETWLRLSELWMMSIGIMLVLAFCLYRYWRC